MMTSPIMASMSTPILLHLSKLMTRLIRLLAKMTERRRCHNYTFNCRRSPFVYASILHDRFPSIQQPYHSWSTMLPISDARHHNSDRSLPRPFLSVAHFSHDLRDIGA